MDDFDVFDVHLEVARIIPEDVADGAQQMTVQFVDRWAAKVIAAYIGTSNFPLHVQIKFMFAISLFSENQIKLPYDPQQYRNCPNDRTSLLSNCRYLLYERLCYWADRSIRFRARPKHLKAASVPLT